MQYRSVKTIRYIRISGELFQSPEFIYIGLARCYVTGQKIFVQFGARLRTRVSLSPIRRSQFPSEILNTPGYRKPYACCWYDLLESLLKPVYDWRRLHVTTAEKKSTIKGEIKHV